MERSDHDAFFSQLVGASQAEVLRHHAMAEECTFGIGGKADFFCRPATSEALQDTVRICHEASVPCLLIGGGANLLFRDEGFPGVVISTTGLDTVQPAGPGQVRVGAGLDNRRLTEYALAQSLTGFEWATDLPGSVGGGIFMNAKCYGASFSDIVSEVRTLAPDRSWQVFTGGQCGFAYKNSVFQHNGHIIVEAVLALAPGDARSIAEETARIRADRQSKGQFVHPSAGCAFKNNYDVGIPSGKLIEDCGLKGTRIGDVQIYESHANFIVNLGNGRTRDVVALMRLIEETVWEKHQVRLEPEIRIVP